MLPTWWPEVAVTMLATVGASVIIMLLRHFNHQRRVARLAELEAHFVRKDEHTQQLEALQLANTKQHNHNAVLLEELRIEAHKREERVLGTIERFGIQQREDLRTVQGELADIGKRVDQVFIHLGPGNGGQR